jgi:hypothetical protein
MSMMTTPHLSSILDLALRREDSLAATAVRREELQAARARDAAMRQAGLRLASEKPKIAERPAAPLFW